MPRLAWSLPIIAVLALTLVSCFDDVKDCPTCPPVKSGRIEVFLPGTFDIDSVRVGIDAPPQYRLRRGETGSFASLSAGTHTLNSIIYRQDINGLLQTTTSTISVELDRGETRTVVFHHDFPVVVWAPPPAGPADARIAAAGSGPLRRAG